MSRTRLFLDTEFTALSQSAELISIALVSETGAAFYAELTDFNTHQLSDWHRHHVLPNLFLDRSCSVESIPDITTIRGDSAHVRASLTDWLQTFGPVEIWADVLAWDWVLFCQLFDGAFGLPKNIFYIPFDLSTLIYLTGTNPDVSREAFAFPNAEARKKALKDLPFIDEPKHNALWDAQVAQECFRRLQERLPELLR